MIGRVQSETTESKQPFGAAGKRTSNRAAVHGGVPSQTLMDPWRVDLSGRPRALKQAPSWRPAQWWNQETPLTLPQVWVCLCGYLGTFLFRGFTQVNHEKSRSATFRVTRVTGVARGASGEAVRRGERLARTRRSLRGAPSRRRSSPRSPWPLSRRSLESGRITGEKGLPMALLFRGYFY